jgi:hypothetical protein
MFQVLVEIFFGEMSLEHVTSPVISEIIRGGIFVLFCFLEVARSR